MKTLVCFRQFYSKKEIFLCRLFISPSQSRGLYVELFLVSNSWSSASPLAGCRRRTELAKIKVSQFVSGLWVLNMRGGGWRADQCACNCRTVSVPIAQRRSTSTPPCSLNCPTRRLLDPWRYLSAQITYFGPSTTYVVVTFKTYEPPLPIV